ncbi:MAG: hypothetical protein H0X43_13390 [Nitrosospira sp.]|nr:hypothetical protein [Nitrosospira sp.]
MSLLTRLFDRVIKMAQQLGIHLTRRVPIDYSTYIPLLRRISCRVVRRINQFVPLRPKPKVHSVTFLLSNGKLSRQIIVLAISR